MHNCSLAILRLSMTEKDDVVDEMEREREREKESCCLKSRGGKLGDARWVAAEKGCSRNL